MLLGRRCLYIPGQKQCCECGEKIGAMEWCRRIVAERVGVCVCGIRCRHECHTDTILDLEYIIEQYTAQQ
jgi:hypothetical protein